MGTLECHRDKAYLLKLPKYNIDHDIGELCIEQMITSQTPSHTPSPCHGHMKMPQNQKRTRVFDSVGELYVDA